MFEYPTHIKYVATLPNEIWMSENWQQSEICIVINDKSQGCIAKHLSCDGLLYYKFITQSTCKYFNRLTFGEITGKMVDCVIRPILLRVLSSKMQNSTGRA